MTSVAWHHLPQIFAPPLTTQLCTIDHPTVHCHIRILYLLLASSTTTKGWPMGVTKATHLIWRWVGDEAMLWSKIISPNLNSLAPRLHQAPSLNLNGAHFGWRFSPHRHFSSWPYLELQQQWQAALVTGRRRGGEWVVDCYSSPLTHLNPSNSSYCMHSPTCDWLIWQSQIIACFWKDCLIK